MAHLVYETTDPEFAERALSAMREHDIPCYRVGHGYSDSALRASPESQICLYIERDTDAAAANRLLIELGAVVERPVPRRVYIGIVLFAAVISVWLAWEFSR